MTSIKNEAEAVKNIKENDHKPGPGVFFWITSILAVLVILLGLSLLLRMESALF